MNSLATRIFFSLGLGVLAISPAAKAGEWNQKTVLTFSESVEIPGQVLPAGTYVFKLANSNSNSHIVQVFNKSEDRVFGTFLAIPSHRVRPSETTVIRFEERAADSPQAIKSWFYPYRNIGHEFVYPKNEAVELAKANNEPVPAMPTELTAETKMPRITLERTEIAILFAAPLKAEEPNGEEVELAAAFPDSASDAAALPEELPDTASSLPLMGLAGLLSIGAAGILRIRAARVRG
jgi:hypothetical protein